MDRTTTATPMGARTTTLVRAEDTQVTIRRPAVGVEVGVILRQRRSEEAS